VEQRSHFTTSDRPTWDLYSTCIHCGLCLEQCPTYRVLGLEADSPRGRIYQILQVDNGNLSIADSFVTHIDRCLGCLACQTACPSGVNYGHIVERARAEIEQNYRRPLLARVARRYAYKKLLKSFPVLAFCAKLLRFYQRSGLQKFARASGVLEFLRLGNTEALAPHIDDHFSFDDLGKTFPAEGEQRARVAFLIGCIASVSFAELNRATIRVLQKNGVSVYLPPQQGCCGALHAHAGFREDARDLARKNIDALLATDVDTIITNAAGCGSTMKEYDDLLASDPAYAEKAKAFVAKTKDVNEFLAWLGLRSPRQKIEARITYQDPCHLAHAQKIRSAPRELLKAIGADLIEMPHSDQCCGSAGTYNVVQNELSMKILEAKMEDVSSTDAEIIATANIGCMLQLRAGVTQHGLNRRVAHVIELLDEAYR
jgi:glycolate dehydrogenase iron-sulfur subunit